MNVAVFHVSYCVKRILLLLAAAQLTRSAFSPPSTNRAIQSWYTFGTIHGLWRHTMSATAHEYMTAQQYFTLEETSDGKHEYYRGAIYAMTGGTARHNLIVANLIALLHGQLRGTTCRVFPSDLRLKIELTGLYTYPDVSVICGPISFGDNRQDTVTNPVVLIEVLSPSTENYDRGRKFEHYRTIDTLQEYVVVAQDRVHIEHYVRQDNNRWVLVDFSTIDQIVHVGAINCTLSVELVYENIMFDNQDE